MQLLPELLSANIYHVQHIGPAFTPLEQTVLRVICEMHAVDRDALEAQLSSATVLSRENTGAGFFTRIDVGRSTLLLIGGERRRDGPEARIDGLEHGMGFILWLKEGYLDCLEGYSYADSTIGIDFEKIDFEILPQ